MKPLLNGLSILAVITLMSSAPAASECRGSSAPGRMACTATDIFNNAARRADDINVGAAIRRADDAIASQRARAASEIFTEQTRQYQFNMAAAAKNAQQRTTERMRLQTQEIAEKRAKRALSETPPPKTVPSTQGPTSFADQIKHANRLKAGLNDLPHGKQRELLGAAIQKTEKKGRITVALPKGPDFLVTPNGTSIPMGKGTVGPLPTAKPGVQFLGGQGGNGLHNKITGVRVMDANKNQGKRVIYMNKSGQIVDAKTGKTVSHKDPRGHNYLSKK